MKSSFLRLSLMIATVALAFTSCKKADTDDSISAADNAAVSNAVNQTSDDAANSAGQVASFSGKTDGWHGWGSAILCGVTIIDTPTSSTSGGQLITITYDGTSSCNGVIRSGTVTVALTSGTYWRNANSVLTVTITNLKITDIATGGSYTINGTHTITNVTGGLAWQVVAGMASGPVTHRITSDNMTITFADNSQRTWSVNRLRSWSNTGGVTTVTLSSDQPGNKETWGTNRFGGSFTNSITQAISADNADASCYWKPYTGTYVHQIGTRTATVLFGTNTSGTQDGTATTCADGFYITYTNANRTKSRFIGYWH